MCSQLIHNVNISLDLCTNMSGGFWETAGALRFGEGSGKVRAGTEGAAGKVRAGTEPAPRGQRGGKRRTPLWTSL